MHTWDVVVVGSGVAGTAAALAAADRGARVAVIHWKPGATALSNGSWSGAAPEPLLARLRQAGYDVRGASQPLLSPDGAVLRAPAAASTHLPTLTGRVLVCGIAGLPGFHARALSRLWGDQVAAELLPTDLLLPATPPAGWSAGALCRRIEADPTLLSAALHPQVEKHRPDALVLPAILGLEHSARVRATLEHIVGCPVAEALGALPSIPGWRLQHALRATLEAAGVTVIDGLARLQRHASAIVSSLLVANQALGARSIVVATGKFIGGGIEAEDQIRDVFFDRPIEVEHLGESFDRVEPLTLTNPNRHDDQPLLAIGVSTDAEGRILNAAGDVLYRNVWCAGAVRAGAEMTLGRAAAEGWAAGERAAA